MIVSDAYQFVFIEMPRNASRSVSEMLIEQYDGFRVDGPLESERIAFAPVTRHTVCKRPEWEDYFFFAVVRNPYDRVVSGWRHSDMDFGEYVKEFISTDLVTNRKHPSFSLTQSDFEDMYRFDGLVRFESLREDLQKLPFVDKPLLLQHIGKTEGRRDVFDTLAEHEVYSWAAEDFERYGYRRRMRFV